MFESLALSITLPFVSGAFPPSGLPYALIGEIVVSLVLVVLAIAVVVVAAGFFFVGWVQGFRWLSNRMYNGYDVEAIEDEERLPPVWKIRVAGVALALSRFEFRKVGLAYREAPDLTENDETVREYLKKVFVD